MLKRKIGDMGEELACKYLKKKKYKIIDRNFQTRYGEIDIIALKKDVICFVEVKTRNNDDFQKAYESVTSKKMERIKTTAFQYLQKNHGDKQLRFDIIEVYTNRENKNKIEINHYENAFI
ncbi:MAG: YraN family protein [Clostridia bacterium]|nr:YraN family protein [Clostridia bacterium]